MNMRDCPRYATCSAPLCPLDPDWRRRSHFLGERVCIWLTELAKPEGEKRVAVVLGDETTGFVARILPAIAERGPIRHVLDRAAHSGSKLEAQQRLSRFRASSGGV